VLPKENRLKTKKDFESVLKSKHGLRLDPLFLKWKKNNSKKRFGFLVSKKISKKATIRNKIKRQLRVLVAQKIKEIKEGFDIVLIALPTVKEKKFPELKETLEELFKEAKILKH
jgi:ribonuclease P protein component